MFQIFPAIDLRGGQCVRLKQGDYAQETVFDRDPAATAREWEAAGGNLIHLVDLDAAKAGHPVNLDTVQSITQTLRIPCEIGGGIRTLDDAQQWLDAGVSRIILGTVAVRNPQLVLDLIAKHSSEKIVLGIDARDGKVAVTGWTEVSALSALELARNFVAKGVQRIIFTDIATDGMMSGPNLPALKTLCEAVPTCKIIASGGVSTPQDIIALRRLNCPNLEGAIVGRAIYENADILPQMIAAACEPLEN